jgi:hypothetical protein
MLLRAVRSPTTERIGWCAALSRNPVLPSLRHRSLRSACAYFIGALVAITVRVSSPQSEKLSSLYETPEDLVRVALGFAACLWVVLHLFTLPRTAEGYKRWVYLGLVIAPIACAVAVIIWR